MTRVCRPAETLTTKKVGAVSHYKSNLRDIEFNLFEVLGRDEVLGTGPFGEVDSDTAREILAEVDRLSREELAASYEDSDRNPPVFDPDDQHRADPRVLQEELPGLDGLRVLAPADQRGARRHPRPLEPGLGARRAGPRRQRPRLDVRRRPAVRRGRAPQRQRARQAHRRDHGRAPVGRHDGADRARRGLRRRRRPRQGHRRTTTAPGTSRASSASSPRPSTT